MTMTKLCDSDEDNDNDLLFGKDRNKLLCTTVNKQLLNLANIKSLVTNIIWILEMMLVNDQISKVKVKSHIF